MLVVKLGFDHVSDFQCTSVYNNDPYFRLCVGMGDVCVWG